MGRAILSLIGRGVYCVGVVAISLAVAYLSRYGSEQDVSLLAAVLTGVYFSLPGVVLLVVTRRRWFRASTWLILGASATIYLVAFALISVDLFRSPIPRLKLGLALADFVHLLHYYALTVATVVWVATRYAIRRANAPHLLGGANSHAPTPTG